MSNTELSTRSFSEARIPVAQLTISVPVNSSPDIVFWEVGATPAVVSPAADNGRALTSYAAVIQEEKPGCIRSGLSWLARIFCCCIGSEKDEAARAYESAQAAYEKSLEVDQNADTAFVMAKNKAYLAFYPKVYAVASAAYKAALTANGKSRSAVAADDSDSDSDTETAVQAAYKAAQSVTGVASNEANWRTPLIRTYSDEAADATDAVRCAASEVVTNVISDIRARERE